MKINLRSILSATLPIFILSIFITSSPLAARPSGSNLLPEMIPTDTDQPVVARVYFADFADLNRLATSLDIWEVNHNLGYLVALLPSERYQGLIQEGYKVEIDLDKTSQLHKQNQTIPSQSSGIPGYPCYRTVEETYTDLSQLALDNPTLASWIDIGDSWEKTTPGGPSGYDLNTLILTNTGIPGPKPRFYLISAIHAREYPTAELVTRFAEYLVENYGIDPDITWMLDYFEVHITPHANPDGRLLAEAGNSWRKNTDNDDGCLLSYSWGTDLNRNSSFKWAGVGASSDPCNFNYHGPSSASEPETQALQNYAAAIFPDQRGPGDTDPAPQDAVGIFITLHSYGELVLFPWGWTTVAPPNDTPLETLGRKFGFFTQYEVCQSGEDGCIYQTSGSTDDWVYAELGVASYTFELGTYFFESCANFEQTVFPNNLPALLYAFKSTRRPYQHPAGPETLDLALSSDHIAPGAGLILSGIADDTRYSSQGWGAEPVQSIAAARFSIDAPSWVGGTTTYPLIPSDGSFDTPIESLSATVDTTSLVPGRHTIFVESQDADSNWGVPSAVFFWITGEDYLPGLVPSYAEGAAQPGSTASYNFQITNLGTQDDYFSVQITGNNWVTVFPSVNPIGPLIPGESALFAVTVEVPEDAEEGTQDNAILTITSHGNSTKFAMSTIKTTAGNLSVFLPLINK